MRRRRRHPESAVRSPQGDPDRGDLEQVDDLRGDHREEVRDVEVRDERVGQSDERPGNPAFPDG
ncbi:hypothetical protein VA596_46905 [Amycolatopsis sp., V23-08]|uniref:Uncharacterized protein n=1 Tax=Amycolatopsis heterodermiae TaxID=3110235 RepID=A0ABU5RLR3_9PSEU|nr:hypothetical protein [Amycolatopsis sp., V23-08]MEA5367128.1 hypothetical protein [Amycolatopsis sp., V23-08]